jgi:colanic acid biosynthesis protein WcaH
MIRSDVLNEEEFGRIVRCAPLVSIDLVIRDPERKVLLGLRNHEPAKGYYFVPGGRIRKGELLEEAFSRILVAETGCRADFESARFLGVHQHMYSTNRFGNPDFGTHYVVLAYELNLICRPTVLLDSQHSVCKWMDEADLKSMRTVHQFTKAYFEN